MKQRAINSCLMLAQWLFDGHSFAWSLSDRIERRWNIQGATEHEVARLRRVHADFLAAESKQYDRQNPNRLTYLHR